jgi:hypothetical protein
MKRSCSFVCFDGKYSSSPSTSFIHELVSVSVSVPGEREISDKLTPEMRVLEKATVAQRLK